MAKTEEITELQAQAAHWWVLLLQGGVFAIIGWMLLKQPAITVIQLAVILGLYMLIAGIVDVVASLFEIGHHGSRWGLKLFGGLVGIIVGLFVLNNPILTGIFTPLFIMYFGSEIRNLKLELINPVFIQFPISSFQFRHPAFDSIMHSFGE